MAKAKPQELPGVEGDGVSPQKKIPAIEKAADKYTTARDERMALTKKEVETRANLAAVMHENSLTRYVYDDLLVTCVPGKEKIKVKTIDGPDDLEDED